MTKHGKTGKSATSAYVSVLCVYLYSRVSKRLFINWERVSVFFFFVKHISASSKVRECSMYAYVASLLHNKSLPHSNTVYKWMSIWCIQLAVAFSPYFLDFIRWLFLLLLFFLFYFILFRFHIFHLFFSILILFFYILCTLVYMFLP